VIQVIQVKRKT